MSLEKTTIATLSQTRYSGSTCQGTRQVSDRIIQRQARNTAFFGMAVRCRVEVERTG